MLVELRQQLKHLPRGLRTRFAPSPTGSLHLGHAASAVFVWGIAQAVQAEVVLRIEDHDQGRVRKEYTDGIFDDLHWLGLIDAKPAFVQQSEHWDRYENTLQGLRNRGQVFACRCSRKEIQERTGELSSEELRYDGHCRSTQHSESDAGIRLLMEPKDWTFLDLWVGPQTQKPAEQCGDLLIRDRMGYWTYHFAVSIDDAAEDIDLIIRGQDLLSASGRQLQLRQLIGCRRTLQFIHHPLIWETPGQKLSKRNGSTAIRSLREQGIRPEALLGQAAFAVGLIERPRDIWAQNLGELFS